MLSTVSDIKTTWLREVDSDLEALHTRMQDDLELWLLNDKFPDEEDSYPSKGHHKMVRNDARALADKVIGTLLTAQIKFRVPLIYGEEHLADRNSDLERVLMAFIEEADRRLVARLGGGLLTSLLHQTCLRGWICGVALLRPSNDDTRGFVPDVTIWEPMETYFSLGRDGVYRAGHRHWEIEGELALDYPRLGLDSSSRTLKEVVDFWEIEKGKVYNSIIIGDDFAKPPTRLRGKRFPVVLIPAPGPIPMTEDTGLQADVDAWGESIFATNRQVYRKLNQLDTETLDVALREAHRGLLLSGAGAPSIAKSIDEAREEDIAHAVRDSVDARPMPERSMPRDLHLLRATLEAAAERGGLAGASWGQIRWPLSGLAIANLAAQEASFLSPRVQALKEAYRSIALCWLDQLARWGKETEVIVRGKERGKLQRVKLSVLSEVPEIEVSIEPKIVGQQLQAAAMALQMRQRPPGGFPILSDETIWEQHLGVEDPRRERERILREAAMSLPFMQMQLQGMAFRADGQDDYARIMELMADRNFQDMMVALTPKPPPQLPPQLPPMQPGMQPETQPMAPMGPEMMPMPPPEAMSPVDMGIGAPMGAGTEPGPGDLERLLAMGLVPPQQALGG